MPDMHKLLGLGKQDYQRMLERKHLKSFEYQGMTYYCLSKEFRHLERGTSIIKGAVIRGFPKIRRALYLGPALSRHFSGRVAVEEKMNGYNVRVARVEEKILALTRGDSYVRSRLRKCRSCSLKNSSKMSRSLCCAARFLDPRIPTSPSSIL